MFASAHSAVASFGSDLFPILMPKPVGRILIILMLPALAAVGWLASLLSFDSAVGCVISHMCSDAAEPGRMTLLTPILAAVMAPSPSDNERSRTHAWNDETLPGLDPTLMLRLEASPDGVVICNTEGGIVYVNAQTERLFGYRSDELINKSIETLLPQQRRSKHVEQRAEFLETRRHRPMGTHPELRALHKDGTEFPVAIMLTRVETPNGMLAIADVRDLTDLREAKRQLEGLNELKQHEQQLVRDFSELAAVNRELEAFSYSVSHDLRTPLRALDGFSQALLEDYADKLDDDGKHLLTRIRSAAQRMGAIIDDLLKLSRITRHELDYTEVDLSAMAKHILNGLIEGKSDRQIEITIADGLTTDGDSRLLRLALENLLNNALKFTAQRNPARIKVGQVNLGDEIPFFVSDNGAGFDMSRAGKLFGAFQRLHDPATFPGTGIGLATVQRIIHKHGGRIWAEAEVDKGATFYFTI
jgi:PAS domain S-box-containing protein